MCNVALHLGTEGFEVPESLVVVMPYFPFLVTLEIQEFDDVGEETQISLDPGCDMVDNAGAIRSSP